METAYERFEVPLKIQSEDIDVLGHVNNVVYLRWVQEAAIAHWTAAATEEEQLAAARTVWCPLDPETFQPTDVSEAVRSRFSVPDGREA